MAKLRIVRVDGSDTTHTITPAIEFAFEAYAKKGLHKAFREDEKQSDVYLFANIVVGFSSFKSVISFSILTIFGVHKKLLIEQCIQLHPSL